MPDDTSPPAMKEWYASRNCTHAHCPHDCDKPQPFMLGDDLVCGKCAVFYGEVSKMIPCTPEVCD